MRYFQPVTSGLMSLNTDYRTRSGRVATLLITDYRLPITDYRLPITDYRLLAYIYRKSTPSSTISRKLVW